MAIGNKLGQAYAKLELRSQHFNTKLASSQRKFQSTTRRMQQRAKRFGRTMQKAWKTAAIGTAVLSAGVAKAVSMYTDFEDAQVELAKKLGQSRDQLQGMTNDLTMLSTKLPTTRQELVEIAAGAAQVGVQKENIAAFAKTMIQWREATGQAVDAATTFFGSITSVSGAARSSVVNLGSALAYLLDNFPVKDASKLTETVQRLGTQLFALGESQAGVAGLAGVIASLKPRRPQRVATRTITAFRDMASEMDKWAEAAGMTREELKTLFDDAPTKALRAWIDGFKETNNVGDSASDTLAQLNELMSSAAAQGILPLVQGQELLNRALDEAHEKYEEGTTLQEKYEIGLTRLSTQLQITKGNVQTAAQAFGGIFAPTIRDLNENVLQPLTTRLAYIMTQSDETRSAIRKLVLTMLKIGGVITVLGLVVKAFMMLASPVFQIMALAGLLWAAYELNLLNIKDFIDGTLIPAFETLGQKIGNIAGSIGIDWEKPSDEDIKGDLEGELEKKKDIGDIIGGTLAGAIGIMTWSASGSFLLAALATTLSLNWDKFKPEDEEGQIKKVISKKEEGVKDKIQSALIATAAGAITYYFTGSLLAATITTKLVLDFDDFAINGLKSIWKAMEVKLNNWFVDNMRSMEWWPGGPKVFPNFGEYKELADKSGVSWQERLKKIDTQHELIEKARRKKGIKLIRGKDTEGKIKSLRELVEELADPHAVIKQKDINRLSNLIEDIKSATDNFTSEQQSLLRVANNLIRISGYEPEKRQKGGPMGLLPGYGGGDRIPALLEQGEFIWPKEMVKSYPGIIRGLWQGFQSGGEAKLSSGTGKTSEDVVHPALRKIQQARKIVLSLPGTTEKTVSKIFDPLEAAVGGWVKDMGNFKAEWEKVQNQAAQAQKELEEKLNQGGTEWQKKMSELSIDSIDKFKEYLEAAKGSPEKILALNTRVSELIAKQKELIKARERFGLSTDEARKKLNRFQGLLHGASNAVGSFAGALQKFGDTIVNKLRGQFGNWLDKVLGLTDEIKNNMSDLNVAKGFKRARTRWGAAKGDQPATVGGDGFNWWEDILGPAVKEGILGIFDNLDLSGWLFGGIWDWLTGGEDSPNLFGKVWGWLTGWIPDFKWKKWINPLNWVKWVGGALSSFGSSVMSAGSSLLSALGPGGIVVTAVTAAMAIFPEFRKAVGNVISGLWDGITNFVGGIGRFIGNLFGFGGKKQGDISKVKNTMESVEKAAKESGDNAVGKIAKVTGDFIGSFPALQSGGTVLRTGIAKVHEGEVVLNPAKMSGSDTIEVPVYLDGKEIYRNQVKYEKKDKYRKTGSTAGGGYARS